MSLQPYNIAVGRLETGSDGENYEANQAVYILTESDTLQSIYSDAEGLNQIVQDGVNNVTNSRGEFNFFCEGGRFKASINGVERFIGFGFSSSFIFNYDGSSVQNYIEGQQFENVNSVKSYTEISKLIGQRIRTKEYHDGTGYGGATYDVVETSTVTPNNINIIQSAVDSSVSFVLVTGDSLHPVMFGAGNGDDDYDSLIECLKLSYHLNLPIYGFGYTYLSSGTLRFSEDANPEIGSDCGWSGGTLKMTASVDYAIAPFPNAASVTEGGFLKSLVIDCNHLSGGLDPKGTRGFTVTDCTAKKIGAGKIGFDRTELGRETKYTRCVAYQWEFTDDEFTDPTKKTATAYRVGQSDNYYTNCVALGCDVGFDIYKGFNKITGIHPYACNSNVILRNSVELQDINGYFDNGEFIIEGFSGRTKITGYFLRGSSIPSTDPRHYDNFITFKPDSNNQNIAGVTIDAMFRNGSDAAMYTTGEDSSGGTLGDVSDSYFKMQIENVGSGSVTKRSISGSFNSTRLDLSLITPSASAANIDFDITNLKLTSNAKKLVSSVTPALYGNSRARGLFAIASTSGFVLGELVTDSSGVTGYVTCILGSELILVEQISNVTSGLSGDITGSTSGSVSAIGSFDEELGTYIAIDSSCLFTAASVTVIPTFRGFPYSGKVNLCRIDWSVSE